MGFYGLILVKNIEINKCLPFNDFVKCPGRLLERIRYIIYCKQMFEDCKNLSVQNQS